MPDLLVPAADSITAKFLRTIRAGAPVPAASGVAPGSIYNSLTKWCALAVSSDARDDEEDVDVDDDEGGEDLDDEDDDFEDDEFLDDDDDEFLDDEDDEDLDDDEGDEELSDEDEINVDDDRS